MPPQRTAPAPRRVVATAPGKVMLAGEYAVLHGAEAVLVAVDRRVIARLMPAAPGRGAEQSPVLAAVRRRIALHTGADSPAARAAARIACASDALRDDRGVKLGLGSSAAVTVAATSRALAAVYAVPPTALVHELAHLAHGDAQARRGARGSGADVAACTHGGTIAVVPVPGSVPLVRPLGRIPGALVFVWTGRAADTVELVSRVEAFAAGAPREHQARMDALADAAADLAAAIASLPPGAGEEDAPAALGAGDAVVRAVAAGAEAVAALGRAAGVALETDAHRALAALARRHGGAAKPTGAGGGDVALAAFATAAAAGAFCDDARAAGVAVLDLAVDPDGVRLQRDPDSVWPQDDPAESG